MTTAPMSSPHRPVVVLSRALDQAGDALAAVHPHDIDRPTPCTGWTVRQLADHLAAAPEHLLQQARGEEVDWSPGTGAGGDPANGAARPPAEPGTGVGLRNTRARLEQLYGGGQRFALEPTPEGGMAATITVPLR